MMIKLKKTTKRIIDRAVSSDIRLLDRYIQKYDYISFDIFDTLVKRNVPNPVDVFRLIEMEYNKRYSIRLESFRQKRLNAEIQARNKAKGEEICLNHIYDKLEGIPQEAREICKELERRIEVEVCCVNKELIDVYYRCLDSGKRVFLVSDMYLDRECIVQILSKCGIVQYEALYLSCEHNKRKTSGNLFEVMIKKSNINPKQVLHIGDSWKADFQGAKKAGIAAFKIPVNCNRMRWQRREDFAANGFQRQCLITFINNSIPVKTDDFFRFGYEVFGMYLWGFTRWLYQQFQGQGIYKVFFFSRDGYIMKKAFAFLYGETDLKIHYLEVSRRSLRVPILWMDLRLENVLKMLSPSSMITMDAVFEGVGLDIRIYERVIEKHGFSTESVFYRKDILQNKEFRNMYVELLPEIESNSKKEYQCLLRYIEKFDLTGKIAVIDIGWSGGMQRYLQQILEHEGIPTEVFGYYTGIAAYVARNTDVVPMNMKGYLFDFYNNTNETDRRSSFVGLYESLFLEQDGSVEKYVIEEGHGMPVRYPYEYLINGKKSIEAVRVKNIQDGALAFIKEAGQNEIISGFQYTAKELYERLWRAGTSPKKRELEMFAKFRFFDDGQIQYLAIPKSIWYYVLHINQFKCDFLVSRWKTGFLKQLLKLPLPYQYIYNMLLRFKQ